MKDYYYILGIESDATENDIKKAYRKLSVKFHPDMNKGDKFFENRFKEIQEAYETLSNKNKRIIYDSKFKKSSTQNSYQGTKSKDSSKGEIISFDVNNLNIVDDQEITLFWATKNISKVSLNCYKGNLPTTGKKTLKIKSANTKSLKIILTAHDYNHNELSKSVTINYTKKSKEKEVDTNKEKKPNRTTEQPNSINTKSKTLFVILLSIVIFAFIFFLSQKLKVQKEDVQVSNSNNETERVMDDSPISPVNRINTKDLSSSELLERHPGLKLFIDKEVKENLFRVKANSIIDRKILSEDGFLYTEIKDYPSTIIVNDIKFKVFKCENIGRDTKGGYWGLWGEISCSACSGSSGYIAINQDRLNNSVMNMSLIEGGGYGTTGYEDLENDLISVDILVKLINETTNRNYELAENHSGVGYNSVSKYLYRVKSNGKYGFLNRRGKEVIPCIYDELSVFKNGHAIAKKYNERFYIDENNNRYPQLQNTYTSIGHFSENGYAIVSQNQKKGIINDRGTEIVPPIYDYIEESKNHFIAKQNSKFGVYNKEGKIVIPFEYSFIESLYQYFFVAKGGEYYDAYRLEPHGWVYETESGENGVCGLIDNKNYSIKLPLNYQDIRSSYEDNTIINATKDGVDMIFDLNLNCLSGCNEEIKVESPNNFRFIKHGQSPYSYCYGDANNCDYNCSKISVKASYNSDVIVIIKKNNDVFRNAFISKGKTFEFNLPNGNYQTFFYYGSEWNNEKYMKETSCGSLYGGFNENEHFGKDSPQYLNNNILTYELVLQQNGNFSTKSSNLNETF